MELVINGSKMAVPSSVETIRELIDHLNLQSPVIIVEHNEEILSKDTHAQVTLQSGDKIEFVEFVGGG